MNEPTPNPYHKPAGTYKPVRVKTVAEMTVPERFALMFGFQTCVLPKPKFLQKP